MFRVVPGCVIIAKKSYDVKQNNNKKQVLKFELLTLIQKLFDNLIMNLFNRSTGLIFQFNKIQGIRNVNLSSCAGLTIELNEETGGKKSFHNPILLLTWISTWIWFEIIYSKTYRQILWKQVVNSPESGWNFEVNWDWHFSCENKSTLPFWQRMRLEAVFTKNLLVKYLEKYPRTRSREIKSLVISLVKPLIWRKKCWLFVKTVMIVFLTTFPHCNCASISQILIINFPLNWFHEIFLK